MRAHFLRGVARRDTGPGALLAGAVMAQRRERAYERAVVAERIRKERLIAERRRMRGKLRSLFGGVNGT